MKRAVIVTILILMLSTLVAAEYERSDLIDLDVENPTIDELNLFEIEKHVNELTWWVSDNLELSRYEIYKDGHLVKTKSIGGIRQSSKFRDLQAWDDPTYSLIVYDAAGLSAEKNISLNKEAEQEKIEAAIEEAIPSIPVPQLVVKADPEVSSEEEPIIEETAPVQRSKYLLAIAMVLILVALLWKSFSSEPKQKSHKHKRYQDIGLHDYLNKKKKRK